MNPLILIFLIFNLIKLSSDVCLELTNTDITGKTYIFENVLELYKITHSLVKSYYNNEINIFFEKKIIKHLKGLDYKYIKNYLETERLNFYDKNKIKKILLKKIENFAPEYVNIKSYNPRKYFLLSGRSAINDIFFKIEFDLTTTKNLLKKNFEQITYETNIHKILDFYILYKFNDSQNIFLKYLISKKYSKFLIFIRNSVQISKISFKDSFNRIFFIKCFSKTEDNYVSNLLKLVKNEVKDQESKNNLYFFIKINNFISKLASELYSRQMTKLIKLKNFLLSKHKFIINSSLNTDQFIKSIYNIKSNDSDFFISNFLAEIEIIEFAFFYSKKVIEIKKRSCSSLIKVFLEKMFLDINLILLKIDNENTYLKNEIKKIQDQIKPHIKDSVLLNMDSLFIIQPNLDDLYDIINKVETFISVIKNIWEYSQIINVTEFFILYRKTTNKCY